jgi:hypothetical protein
MAFRRFNGTTGRMAALGIAILAILVPCVSAAVLASHDRVVRGHITAVVQRIPPSVTSAGLGSWRLVSSYSRVTATSGQGLATVARSGATPTIVYRGSSSIPLRLSVEGWQHIGDPGAGGTPRNYLFDAYQGAPTATAKLYEVTTPDGNHYDFVHPLSGTLTPPEEFNNSFAAISPNGQWLVSGEWGSMNRLLVFPAPLLNPHAQPTGSTTPLKLAATIRLASAVSDVQGCDFVTASTLLCSSDDPKQLLQISWTGSLAASPTATVTSLGQLPLQSVCTGSFEAEGIDYYAYSPARREMRVEVIPPSPCSILTSVYVYDHA